MRGHCLHRVKAKCRCLGCDILTFQPHFPLLSASQYMLQQSFPLHPPGFHTSIPLRQGFSEPHIFFCQNAILSNCESKFWNEFINFKNHICIYTHIYNYTYMNLLYMIYNKNQTEGFLRCQAGQHCIL